MVSLAEQCLLMMVSSQSFKTCCQRMLLQISFVFTSCSLALPMLCAGCSSSAQTCVVGCDIKTSFNLSQRPGWVMPHHTMVNRRATLIKTCIIYMISGANVVWF